ncbi:MAG: EamA family transporter RarD [Leucobacter sp.]
MPGGRNTQVRGIAASLLASILFGVIFYAAGVLRASAEAIFAWRLVITFACYAAMLVFPPARRMLAEFWRTLTSRWWMPLLFVVLSGLVGLQLWLFAWTPIYGYALDASLGYLLLPIALVAVGRFVFRARVTRLQWLAVGIAILAVVVQILATLSVSWVTFAVCIGYALYFGLRQRFALDSPAAFGGEMLVLLPLAAILIGTSEGAQTAFDQFLVLAAGMAGALGMTAFLAASRLLSMPVFGMLSYGEPILLFVAALLLGEGLQPIDLFVYGMLGIALIVLAAEGFRSRR